MPESSPKTWRREHHRNRRETTTYPGGIQGRGAWRVRLPPLTGARPRCIAQLQKCVTPSEGRAGVGGARGQLPKGRQRIERAPIPKQTRAVRDSHQRRTFLRTSLASGSRPLAPPTPTRPSLGVTHFLELRACFTVRVESRCFTKSICDAANVASRHSDRRSSKQRW
jgi:hypothetical protein